MLILPFNKERFDLTNEVKNTLKKINFEDRRLKNLYIDTCKKYGFAKPNKKRSLEEAGL